MGAETQRYAILVAGGSGLRMGLDTPKQFLSFGSTTVLEHTLNQFAAVNPAPEVIIVLPTQHRTTWQQLASKNVHPHRVVVGGETRFHSVLSGLRALQVQQGLVAIHDAVRPLVSPGLIEQCYQTCAQKGSAIPVVPVVDSLRQGPPDLTHLQPVARENFWRVQTPQTFRLSELLRAFEQGYDSRFTDDASVFESAGGTLHYIPGEETNLKITRLYDWHIAQALLKLG